MSEVGALIIKLQAETAQFRQDLGKVKSDLNDLKGGSQETGRAMDYSFKEARGGLMLTEDLVGVRLPRHLNTLIAQIPGVGAAFASMLPIVGVAVAIEIIGKLIEKHREMKEEAEKLAQAEMGFGTTVNNVYNKLDDKLLEAGIKADELAGNHLAALHKELQLIDNQTLEQLAQQFDIIAKAADAVFAQLKTSWYQVGSGSAGAAHALEDFKVKYDSLLAQGKDKEAADLLAGTHASAEKVLELQKQVNDNITVVGGKQGDYNKFESAKVELQKQGIGYSEKEVTAQQELVNALTAQVNVQQKLDALKKAQDQAATQKTNDAVERDDEAVFKIQVAEAKKAADEAEKQEEEAYQRAVSAIQEAEKEKIAATKSGTQARVDAIDAAIKEENAKGLQETAFYKSLLIERINAVKAAADMEARIEASKAKLAAAQQATQDSAVLEGIKLEEAALDDQYSRGLIYEAEYLAKKIALFEKERDAKIKVLQEESNAQAIAAKQAAALGDVVAENNALTRQAELQRQLTQLKGQYITQIARERTAATQLQHTWSDYFGQMKTQTQNLSTQIRTNLQQSVTQFTRSFADSMAQCIVENKSLGQAVRQEAGQMLASMISMLIQWLEKWIITHTIARLFQTTTDQAGKASAASLAGANMVASWSAAPWPIDALAPAMGATAFAAAMAFEKGGKIPGEGAVPIIGHGGETVVTKALTDRVEASEGRGSSAKGGNNVQVHNTFAPQIHAIDAEGVDAVLKKHSAVFQRHVASTVRKLNR